MPHMAQLWACRASSHPPSGLLPLGHGCPDPTNWGLQRLTRHLWALANLRVPLRAQGWGSPNTPRGTQTPRLGQLHDLMRLSKIASLTYMFRSSLTVGCKGGRIAG